MRRKIKGNRLVVASHNKGKIREIKELLTPFNFEVSSAVDLQLIEPEEVGKTFIENAELKARCASAASRLVALADDSGLVVPELDGNPGIYSARWAGPERNFDFAMERVQRELEKLGPGSTREAYFVSALSLAWPDGHCESFEGRATGRLIWPPRGDQGFGYDPMFEASGNARTFGEMDYIEKYEISHRADAFHKLVKACFE